MKTGIELIAEERQEQIKKHGRTVDRDIRENQNQQLSQGAEMLLAMEHEEDIDSYSHPDGWDEDICAHMLSKPYRDRLIIAGALIAAELDRLEANTAIEKLLPKAQEAIDKSLLDEDFDIRN